MPVLVVQMGHCFRKTGATGTGGEQAFAKAVAEACVAHMHGGAGWSVRAILADEASSAYRGDAFVAVHCDGSTSSAARGASVGYRTPEGQALGQAWKRAYADRGWPGFRPDNYTAALANYYGTGTAVAQGNRRAVIIECGFLTNADDRALLTGSGGVERVALAIGDALGIPTGSPPPPAEEDDMAHQEGELQPAVGAKKWRFWVIPPVADANFDSPSRARLWFATGNENQMDYTLWFVSRERNYLNVGGAAGLKLTAASDAPDYVPIPDGTAQVSIEYSTTLERPVGWRLEMVK